MLQWTFTEALSPAEVYLSAILDLCGSNQFVSPVLWLSPSFQMFCPASLPPVSPGDERRDWDRFLLWPCPAWSFVSLAYSSSQALTKALCEEVVWGAFNEENVGMMESLVWGHSWASGTWGKHTSEIPKFCQVEGPKAFLVGAPDRASIKLSDLGSFRRAAPQQFQVHSTGDKNMSFNNVLQ